MYKEDKQFIYNKFIKVKANSSKYNNNSYYTSCDRLEKVSKAESEDY